MSTTQDEPDGTGPLVQPVEQPRRYAVSPLNGAKVPLAVKGESGNPAGSSLKTRARKALARVLDDPSLENAFKRLAKIAAEAEDDANAVAAIRLIADTAGLKASESDRVLIQTVIELKDRRNGTRPKPMLATQIEREEPRLLGSGGGPPRGGEGEKGNSS